MKTICKIGEKLSAGLAVMLIIIALTTGRQYQLVTYITLFMGLMAIFMGLLYVLDKKSLRGALALVVGFILFFI